MNPVVFTFVIFTTLDLLISCSAEPCRGLFCKVQIPRQRSRTPRPGNRSGGYRRVAHSRSFFRQYPQTKEIWCERLEAPKHGQLLPLTKKRFQPGESVTYKCHTEYRLFGHTQRTCRNDGTWSGKAAFCRGIDCGNPVIQNGNVTLPEGKSTYRSVAHVRCDNKQEVIRSITCDRHGLWRPRTHCRRHKPQIGRHLCKNPHLTRCLIEKSMKVHSLLFRPHEGQELSGNTSSTCLRTGDWYPQLPKCYNNCLTPHIKNSKNVSTNGTVTHDLHLAVECLDGYTLNGWSTIKCSNGIWKPSLPTCSPIIRMHYLQDTSGSASRSELGTFLSLYFLLSIIIQFGWIPSPWNIYD